MSIWVCGEVLVDRFGDTATLGGGPANTARALARLGHDVEFIGGISSDQFGVKAREVFSLDKVGLRHARESEKPTAIASVSLNASGVATYKFDTSETATFDFATEWLPDPSRFKPSILHIGSLATVIQPGATALIEWATEVAEFAPIFFDPNVRPAALNDRSRYVEIFERWASISSIIKASDEDISWLYPDQGINEIATRLADLGLQLFVLTHGDRGISAFTHEEEVQVEAVAVKVVDTVGAGDTAGATIIDAILRHGILNLREALLRETLNCAVHAAAITCSRAGAQPPTRSEVDAAIERSRNAIH